MFLRNRCTTFALAVCVGVGLAARAGGVYAATRVELEIVTGERAEPTTAQAWLRVLQQVGADAVRIRGGRSGDRAQIVTLGSTSSPSFRVVGLVNDRDQLELPGGTFRQQDVAKLRDYVERLKTQGVDGVTGRRGPFGLTKTQFGAVVDVLKRPIRDPAKDQLPADVVRRITASLDMATTIDNAANRRLATGDPVPVEVQSLSSGTGLAAVLAASGLGMTPRIDAQGQLELVIHVARAAEKSWPVGTPVEGPAAATLPVLTETLPVEIKAYPLTDVLAAVQPRFAVPFLMDLERIKSQKIDPATVAVNFPAKRAVYGTVLEAVLTQAQLKYEVRQDEAGAVFVWITTLRQD